jgi:hypothetical protein
MQPFRDPAKPDANSKLPVDFAAPSPSGPAIDDTHCRKSKREGTCEIHCMISSPQQQHNTTRDMIK